MLRSVLLILFSTAGLAADGQTDRRVPAHRQADRQKVALFVINTARWVIGTARLAICKEGNRHCSQQTYLGYWHP